MLRNATKRDVEKAILELRDKGRVIIAEGKEEDREEVIAYAGYFGGHGT